MRRMQRLQDIDKDKNENNFIDFIDFIDKHDYADTGTNDFFHGNELELDHRDDLHDDTNTNVSANDDDSDLFDVFVEDHDFHMNADTNDDYYQSRGSRGSNEDDDEADIYVLVSLGLTKHIAY